MKRNKLMEECRQLISPEVKREIDLSYEIANRIYAILQKRNLTQRDLAKTLKKRESEISKWLTGAHNFTTPTIARIEIALGESLIEVTGKPKQTEKEYVFVQVSSKDYLKIKSSKEETPKRPMGSNWNPTTNTGIAN